MTDTLAAADISRLLRGLRQRRTFTDEPIADDVLNDILEVARWSGSSKNSQPWHLIVVRDKAMLANLAECGMYAGFLAGADVAIVIALHGYSPVAELYDEGRLSERIMLIAEAYGLGSGTAWFGDEPRQNAVRALLNIPADWRVHQAVGLGHVPAGHVEKATVGGGRLPMVEILSHERIADEAPKA